MVAIRDNWKARTQRSAPAGAIMRPPRVSLESKCRTAMLQLKYSATRAQHIIDERANRHAGGFSALLPHLLDSVARKLECAVADLRLDHNPALALRDYNNATKKFTPDADNYYFLIYRTSHDHHIKTHIKGDGALRSDTSERMHRRKLDENRGLRPKKQYRKIVSREFESTDGPRASRKWWGSRAWPKRKMGTWR